MKPSVSPTIAAIVILVVIGIAALVWVNFGEGAGGGSRAATAGMPPQAQAEFQKRMGSSKASQAGAAVPGAATPSLPAGDNTR